MKKDRAVIEEKSSILKALSSPARLCIVKNIIDNGKMNVTEFVDCMDLSQSSVSQHLAKLKDLGILQSTKDGNKVYYDCHREDIKNLIKFIFREDSK